MTFRPISTTRTTQPQGAARVNFGNPLTTGLGFLGVGSSSRLLVLPGLPITIQGSAPRVGGRGVGWYTSALPETANTSLTTSSGNGSGDYCIFALAAPVASGTSAVMLAQYSDSFVHQARLQANLNGSNSEASGAFAFTDIDAAGVFSTVGVGSGVTDGKPHLFCGNRRGTTYELWIDGILSATATQTARDIHDPAGTKILIGADPAGARPSLAPVFLVGGFNRSLSASEAQQFGNNPWQLFAPEPRRIWMPSASGLPTLSAATVTAITATTARPRVTITF